MQFEHDGVTTGPFIEDENRSRASWPSKTVRSGLLARIILSEVDILRGVR